MSKKIEAVALLFNIKTDSFGEMESGELDNIWRVITALASEMGYQVNTYQGTLIKIKK